MKIFNTSNSIRTLSIVVAAMLGISMMTSNSWAEPDGSSTGDNTKRCEKHGKHKQRHGDLSNVLNRLEKDIELTEEQRTAISKVIEQYNPELKALHMQMRAAKDTEMELMKQDSFDEAAIQKHAQEQADLIEKMIVLKAKSKNAIHSHLTDEQKEVIEKKFEQHRMKMNKDNA